jgi:hypothetical protein
MEEERSTRPVGWFYLSYADEDGFRGGVIVRAHGMATAAFEAGRRGISPAGSVMGLAIPEEHVPALSYRNRLLTLEELREFWPDMERVSVLNNEHLQNGGDGA